jgi:hypothetical protein
MMHLPHARSRAASDPPPGTFDPDGRTAPARERRVSRFLHVLWPSRGARTQIRRAPRPVLFMQYLDGYYGA